MNRVVIITCYKDPDYIRAKVLRSALGKIEDLEPIIIKNNFTNFLRYIEVPLRVLWCRLSKRPDKYLITFRGYEVLASVRIITIGKSLYFDEFINLEEWLVYEHKKIKANSFAHKLTHYAYRAMLMSVQKVLTDTDQHAEYSSQLMHLPREKFKSIPVGTDEAVFRPSSYRRDTTKPLEVFYYGTMLPLHGVKHVFDAAASLRGYPIRFTIVGGDEKTENNAKRYTKLGANISYIRRVPFESLKDFIETSDICLGGPFGNTLQSNMVITGKTYQFLACGRATVVGAIGGDTLFKNRENTLVVEQGESGELTAALKWALDNPRKLELIAQNGRKLYEESFSVSEISNKLYEAIF